MVTKNSCCREFKDKSSDDKVLMFASDSVEQSGDELRNLSFWWLVVYGRRGCTEVLRAKYFSTLAPTPVAGVELIIEQTSVLHTYSKWWCGTAALVQTLNPGRARGEWEGEGGGSQRIDRTKRRPSTSSCIEVACAYISTYTEILSRPKYTWNMSASLMLRFAKFD